MDMITTKIECPYFLSTKQQRIVCESINDISTKITMTFKNNELRDDYINDFCTNSCWRGCVLAQLIENKSKLINNFNK